MKTIIRGIFLTLFTIFFGITPSLHAELIGYWPFDEGTGSIVYDSTGNFSPGTISGAHYTQGKVNDALQFDGYQNYLIDPSDYRIDYVEIPNNNIIYSSSSHQLTLSLWVYINDLDNSYSPFIFNKSRGPNSIGDMGIVINPANNLEFYTHEGAGYGGFNHLLYNNLSANKWYYFTTVIDANSLYLYVNGSLADSKISPGIIGENDCPLRFGSTVGLPDYINPFAGIIDEVRIYNHALSQQEILIDMAKGQPVPEPATMLLFVSGLASFAGLRKKLKKT